MPGCLAPALLPAVPPVTPHTRTGAILSPAPSPVSRAALRAVVWVACLHPCIPSGPQTDVEGPLAPSFAPEGPQSGGVGHLCQSSALSWVSSQCLRLLVSIGLSEGYVGTCIHPQPLKDFHTGLYLACIHPYVP